MKKSNSLLIIGVLFSVSLRDVQGDGKLVPTDEV